MNNIFLYLYLFKEFILSLILYGILCGEIFISNILL